MFPIFDPVWMRAHKNKDEAENREDQLIVSFEHIWPLEDKGTHTAQS